MKKRPLTAQGKPISVTVGYRLPLPLYQLAIAQAEKRGVKLSEVLRSAVKSGLGQDPPLQEVDVVAEKTKVIGLRVSLSFAYELRAEAGLLDMSRAAFMREALRETLAALRRERSAENIQREEEQHHAEPEMVECEFCGMEILAKNVVRIGSHHHALCAGCAATYRTQETKDDESPF